MTPDVALRELEAWIVEKLGHQPPVQREIERQWLAARLEALRSKPEPASE